MSVNSTYYTTSLSIFILQDGFSFLVKDEHQKPILFKAHTTKETASSFEILKLIKSHVDVSFIRDNYITSLKLIYTNPEFSIVPKAYFDKSYLPHYLKYSSQLIEGDDFAYDELSKDEAFVVYIPYININNYFFELFGEFKFTHISTQLIPKANSLAKIHQEYVLVYALDQLIYIVTYRKGHLNFANAFKFETPEDFAYYVLFTIDELNYNTEKLHLDFYGKFLKTEDNKAYNILTLYIKNMGFKNYIRPIEFESEMGFDEHYNLF